jgi:uncharacterized repeat protein (TIGR03803 family)
VILDAAGNLYGTTYQGGSASLGVVYKVSPSGQETVLHSFTGAPDGASPYAGVIADSAGNLYGTTCHGGSNNTGAIYELTSSGVSGNLGSWPTARAKRSRRFAAHCWHRVPTLASPPVVPPHPPTSRTKNGIFARSARPATWFVWRSSRRPR